MRMEKDAVHGFSNCKGHEPGILFKMQVRIQPAWGGSAFLSSSQSDALAAPLLFG